jgi:hypothetical protein
MKREQAIIKKYTSNPKNPPLDNPVALLEYEYSNYVESCEYCGEQPLDFDTWINQTIKPLKSWKN